MASIANDDAVAEEQEKGRGKKKKSRRNKKKKDESSSTKNLSFKEKQELRKKQQKEKRQSKQRCYLCGQSGHTRKQCPGIEDGGRGESRYRAKGKGSKVSSFNKKKNRGQKKRAGSFDIESDEITKQDDIHRLSIFQSSVPYIDVNTNVGGLLNRTGQKSVAEACKVTLPKNLKTVISSLNKFSNLSKTYVMDTSQSCKANILYTSGIHPYYADEMEFQIAKDTLADSFKRDDVVGVGPIGLDYSTRCTVDPSRQISIFTEQVKLAVKAGKPLLVHIRPELRYAEGHKKAVKDAATVLSAECPRDYKICVHAYAGANDTLLTLMKLFSNLYVSFSSIITFSKAKHIREVAFDM